jgi:hypothetical protein
MEWDGKEAGIDGETKVSKKKCHHIEGNTVSSAV